MSDTSGKRGELGRNARSPRQIGLSGWKDVLWRVGAEISDDRVFMLASSVAFYAMLALFPALIATVSLYGILADPHQIARTVARLTPALPSEARALVVAELYRIASASRAGLSVGLGASVLFALVSASSGVLGLIDGVNVAYDEHQTRGWLRQRFMALVFAVGLSLFVVSAVAIITMLPRVMQHIGLASETRWLLTTLRWPALAASVMAGLAVLYRYTPSRTPPRWPWVVWGAGLATAIWLLASVLLSAYVAHFSSFDRMYGTLGAIIVLLVWFYVSALAILLGAEINAELERQTTVDTTVGPARPMGKRGATVADALGKSLADKPSESLRERASDLGEVLMRPRRSKDPHD